MKKLFTLLVCTLILTTVAIAQTDTCSYTIGGKILNIETKEPIPYVSITVSGTNKFTLTNLQGDFFIDGLCEKTPTFTISCFGYFDSICTNFPLQVNMPRIYLTQKTLELDELTIHSQKNKEEGTQTISQTTLKRAVIQSDPTQSLAFAISEQQGITLTSTGSNVQLPVIHGLYGNRILILNNGLKHGFQNWGRDHAPEIDISSAHNITIVKGAAGVRFGPEALGGAIIVETNPLHLNKPFYAEMGTGYQTNGKGIYTRLATGIGFKKWSYFLNGNFTKIGDKNTPDYSLTNSGKQEHSLSLGTRYHSKNWDFKIYYSYIHQNLALLRSSIAESGNAFVKAINANVPTFISPFSYAINEPNQLTQHHFGKVEINWWYSNVGKLTFRAGRQLNQREEYDVRRNVDKPIIDLDLITSDYQLEWKHPKWMKLDGLLGFQFFNQDNDNNPGTGTTPLIPNYNTNRYSAFLIESRKLGKNTLEVGVRLEYESNNVRGRETNQAIFKDAYSFTNLTPSIGYVIQLSDHSSFRTNLGSAWRPPNMAELYSFGQHGYKTSFGLLRYYTNSQEELRTDRVIPMSESSIQSEKGYKFINELQTTKGRNTHTATVYSHYIENYIFERPIAVIGTIRGPMPVFIYEQADAFFAGVDYSWKRDWTKQLSGVLGMSYLWSKNIEKNELLINQPPLSVNYRLSYNQQKFWKFESSKWMIRPRYTFQQFQAPQTITPESLIDGSVIITSDTEIFDFKDAPEGYFLLDVSWSFQCKKISGSITVQNLFNSRYRDYLNEMRYFADEPGRNILFSLTYSLTQKKNDL